MIRRNFELFVVKPLLGFCLCLPLAWCDVRLVQAEEKDNPAPAVPPAPAPADVRLLEGVFRDLFAPKGNGRRVPAIRPKPAGNLPDADNSAESRDAIDSRAPHDSKIAQLLQAAEAAVKRKNWKSAIELVQRLLDQPEDSLHRSVKGPWQSVRRSANQMLGQLPEAQLAEYRSQYGGLAQQLLTTARRTGQTADFVNVATRFFHTTAGYEAANYLGSMHFDRSEYVLAARWFEELATSPAAFTRHDPWLMQAALAFARSGDVKNANALLDRLSGGQGTIVNLGSSPIKASEWLNQSRAEGSLRAVALADWTQLYGTASRVGTAIGGDPLLAPNWSLPLTSSNTVRNAIKWLIQDLQDQQKALIMVSAPLVVDGKVIYRDLRGIRSIDIERGNPLWESIEGVSPERILGGLPPQQIDPQEAWRFRMNPFQNMAEYHGASAEYSPLTSLLFRDGQYGLISSDGKQLFVIEDHGILSRNQPGQHWGWDGNADPHDPYGLPWKTNRLVSYDLLTGRPRWSLGGTESRESFDPPLAGSYFYGTPVVEGEELFLVAGKSDDIRLWSLDRKTGAPLWSQLIAYADTKIDVDIARRWITSQVAVGNGIIVCPTTVGWLVAIDRMRQSVLWAHRYTSHSGVNNTERETGSQLVPQRELNAVWSPSAPVITENFVVYTPQEEPLLICLSAVDGRRIWEQPKERGLYLAGVFEKLVLIVGETGVTAYQLADGQSAWFAPFDDGLRPSGRGVMVDNRFYVPLSNGELRSIELQSGKMLSQTFVGLDQSALGNLAMHRGKLVSLSPTGLTVFGQRDALLAEIRQRLSENPTDAWGLLRSSEIHLLNHQYSEALPLLRQIAVDRLTPDEQTRHHAVLIECLSTLIHGDVLHRGAELDELKGLVSTPAERMLYRELLAEKLLAEQKPQAAFEVLCDLADEVAQTTFHRTDDRRITVKRLVWLSGRMFDLWTETKEAERQAIDRRIERLASDAAGRSVAECQRVARLFWFHPSSTATRERLVEWLVEAEDFGGARIVLQQLADDSNRAVAAKATERLARLMLQNQLPADAIYYYRLLESAFSDVVIRDSLTGGSLVAQVRAAKQLDFDSPRRDVPWPTTRMQPVQSVVNYTQPPQNVVLETPLPFFASLSFDAYPNDQRLAMESFATSRVDWMVPLRGAVRGSDEGQLTAGLIGHQIYFVNRGVLHALSPIDKRVLWTKTLDDHGDGVGSGRHSIRPTVSTMLAPTANDGTQSLLLQRANSTGSLAVVQPNYLCVYGRRSLSILDPRTGDLLWELDGLSMNAVVIGNRETLFLIHPGKEEASAFRAVDGKPLDIPGAAKLLNHALLAHGSSFLLLEQDGNNPLRAIGIRRSKVILRLHEPISDTSAWKLELPPRTLVCPLGGNEVVAVQHDGEIKRIDVATGRVTPLESIPPRKAQQQREKYLLSDDQQIYLIVNSSDSGHQSFGESLASVRMNGTVYAWNRNDNQLAWQTDVNHQNLVVDRFATLPVLLCVSRSWKPQGRANLGIGTLNITAVHKQTGQILIDSQIPSAYSGFHAVTLNAEEPSIDLKSYNMRMRLVPTNAPVAAVPDSNPPAAAN